MTFRNDIQILRGISIFLVVFYHLGIKEIASGFLGVDIFFVISGFLMAILYDAKNKTLFLSKRASRLLPAYFCTILITLIVSFIINTPNETAQVSNQAKYASVFSSNIGFWLQNSYFSKSEFNPLLHLWSLGVELQFYLLVPFLAWLFTKRKFILPIVLLISLALCFIFTGISPKTSFFMMPLRLWEFLIGYGAAIYLTNRGGVRYLGCSWVGVYALFVIILIPFMKVDGMAMSIVNGHPGVYSLVVSLATALVLIFGLPTYITNSKIGGVFKIVGNYSYSIYLAHFPIIVLYNSSPFSGSNLEPESLKDTLLILLMIVIFSICLYKFVETKFKRKSLVYLSIIPSCFILLLSFVLPKVQFASLSPKEKLVFSANLDRSTYRCGTAFRIFNPKAISCELTTPKIDETKRFMLVGNSHADSIKTTFTEVAEKENVSVFFLVNNNALMKGGLSPESVLQEAKLRDIDNIVLHYSPLSINAKVLYSFIKLADEVDIGVIFIDPVPIWNIHIPKVMYENIKYNSELPVQTLELYDNYNKEFFDEIKHIKANNFSRYKVAGYFCDPFCIFNQSDGKPLYFDSGHLTLTGSKLLSILFSEVILSNIAE